MGLPPAVGCEPAVEVADVRADLRAGVVFVDRQAEIAQVADDGVRDRALVARRARERRELGEEVDDLGGHRAILCAVYAEAAPTADRSRERSSAAPTNSRKSGAGRVGRDLNSGWNWLATNQG